MAEKDYLANLSVEPEDATHHGIKGMKWGVRRSSSALKAAAKQRIETKATPPVEKKPVTPSSGATRPASNIQDHVESSASRYARLSEQAKLGRASEMTEQDLKFFNARTEALAKINKLNETDPGWLSKTSKKVLQTTAERQLQSVSDAVANKYISGPIIDTLTKSAK